MVIAHFKLSDGCEQVINMPEVDRATLTETLCGLKNDLHAQSFDYYISGHK